MNFSIDTNVVFGVINARDRLHDVSIGLMKDKRNEQLFLCHSVIKESHSVLRNKINEIMVEIIRFLPDIYQNSNKSSLDSQAMLIEQIKNIKFAKPGLANFLDLVFHEISLFLRDHEIEDLPSFLSELSLNLSGSIISKIDGIHPHIGKISLNQDRLGDVKRSLSDIYFKDTTDERIFQELMTNLDKIKPINFFLDDRDFAKKCRNGFARVSNDMGFKDGAFSCKSIQDYAVG